MSESNPGGNLAGEADVSTEKPRQRFGAADFIWRKPRIERVIRGLQSPMFMGTLTAMAPPLQKILKNPEPLNLAAPKSAICCGHRSFATACLSAWT